LAPEYTHVTDNARKKSVLEDRAARLCWKPQVAADFGPSGWNHGEHGGQGDLRVLVVKTRPRIAAPLENPSMDVKNLEQVPSFITADGSEIRELLAHRNSSIRHQSLAEARLAPGMSTIPHYHPKTEEIYYITHGVGLMTIDGEQREVTVGDAIAIPPGARHTLLNTGTETLRLLCCCAPGYEHEDTVLLK
jgi:mannose-6-phosphate isomerase-like protein (cupin superfamily)